jgi:hypothetical protein
MMTFVNVTIGQWRRLRRPDPLDGVSGWVFTRGIEHIFEDSEFLKVQEVLL